MDVPENMMLSCHFYKQVIPEWQKDEVRNKIS